MKRNMIFLAVVMSGFLLTARAQNPALAPAKQAKPPAKNAATAPFAATAGAAEIQKRVESYLRNIFAWGPDFTVAVGALKAGTIDGFYQVPVTVTNQGQSDAATVYVSKDGRYMFRGQVEDLNVNPLAETMKQIQLSGYATKGPADAQVVVVEFADFECPSCRQLEYVLRTVLPKYPQVRFVFKDFPLDTIHPWASTAALAGHCALNQSEAIFWKFHDAVYDDQDLISSENASSKLAEIATAAGADVAAFQACMADPKTPEIVKKSAEEGQKLEITGTPTTFVNGRRIVGPDNVLLEQYLNFDLSHPFKY